MSRGSFLHVHMVAALMAEPTWTPRMYGVYNDVSDDTIEELEKLWAEPRHGLTVTQYDDLCRRTRQQS